jgi:hypothetical protein
MTARTQYVLASPGVAQLGRFWSAQVDALERHLSAKIWALTAAAVVLATYPIARIMIPSVLHAVVPDVVRTMLSVLGV